MRKIFLAAAVGVSMMLSACTTIGGVDQAKFDQLVAAVQSYTATACNFLPVASSVTEVIGALSGAPGIGVAVETIGNAICAGFVTRQAAATSVGGSYVRNVATPKGIVKVRGTRVR